MGVVYRHGSTGLREAAVSRSGEEISGRHVNHPHPWLWLDSLMYQTGVMSMVIP